MLFVAALLCACSQGPGARPAKPAQATEPTPTPEPTPPPIRLGYVNERGEEGVLFIEGLVAEASKRGILAEACIASASSAYDVVVVCAAEGFDAARFASKPPAVIYGGAEPASQTSAPPYARVYYDGSNALSLAYDTALAFPPHDTPVRMIGVFESKDSPASVLFDELYEQGKLLPKATYYADAGKDHEPLSEWLADKLGENLDYEGMVDCLFAETDKLALEALSALQKHPRANMEIFCAQISAQTLASMKHNPKRFAACAGENLADAGRECLFIAEKMAGGMPPVVKTIQPAVVYAENAE